jgi:hypothetical protein
MYLSIKFIRGKKISFYLQVKAPEELNNVTLGATQGSKGKKNIRSRGA